MTFEVNINTFEDLIEFLKTNDLTPTQTNEIINKALKCFFLTDLSKDQMIDSLIEYWDKWKHTKERPFFIDIEDPLG
ncbi:MAG: hypothetical protein JKX84_02965 [Flavobacteriales bacterium]|nr:hypothetical protein [Flavobacteriales bacterium]